MDNLLQKMSVLARANKFIWLLIIACGCDNDSKVNICDCEGSLQSFENYRGVVALARTNDYVIVSDKLGFVSACSGFDESLKIDGQKVIFSGSYVNNCIKENPSYGISTFGVKLSSIQKSDTIYSAGPLYIEIIHSEDDGFPPGFGYYLKYTTNGVFEIRQATIPGIGGNIPFASEADAFKIAIRVGWRLSTVNDFPSTPYADLYYLQIVE